MLQYAVGLDLGGTNIKAALVERKSGIIASERIPTEAEHGVGHVLARIEIAVRRILRSASDKHVCGIGIGAPGTVNLQRTNLIHPPNIPGWTVVDVRSELQRRLGHTLHVVVENDANAAALGSAQYGAGRPYDSFVMVTLGTGVGGAIIWDNSIFRGSTGAAGEIGHMTIDSDGPEDEAGVKGAIEAYLGIQHLSRHARRQLKAFPNSCLYEIAGADLGRLTPEMLSEAASRGDEGALSTLEWAGQKLGAVLGACVNLLDIRTIIVGGGVSAAGTLILDPARRSILAYLKPGMRDGVAILRETLGNKAGMLGAAYLVFELLDRHASTSEES